MKVSVIIPTLNAGPLFKEVLEGVKAQEIGAEVELVIVDSMSEDGTAELGKKYADVFFQVKRAEFNHGETRNLAIAKSSGELIALLVQDAFPRDSQWLKKLADNFSDPKVAGAYSRQIPQPDCNPLIRIRIQGWASGKTQKRIQELTDNDLCADRGVCATNSGEPPARKLTPEQIREAIETFSFDNVSSMVRRSAWDQVKFPKRRFAEDIGWCKEVLSYGFKVVYEPESVVIHSHNKSLFYEFKRIYLDHQNWWQMGRFRIFNRRRELIGASIFGSVRMIRELWQEGLSNREEREKRKEKRVGTKVPRTELSIGYSLLALGFSLNSLARKGLSLIWWSLYTPFFVTSQNLAQYMGGMADRWKEKYPFYGKIDAILSKGV